MLAFAPCSRAIRAIDAPGCIANSTILRFSAMLRRCRFCPSTYTIATSTTITSQDTMPDDDLADLNLRTDGSHGTLTLCQTLRKDLEPFRGAKGGIGFLRPKRSEGRDTDE